MGVVRGLRGQCRRWFIVECGFDVRESGEKWTNGETRWVGELVCM